jgi:hypothetical protein
MWPSTSWVREADDGATTHFLSFARSSAKKFSTTTTVGVPAISSQLLSRTMRNRRSSALIANVPFASDPARTRSGIENRTRGGSAEKGGPGWIATTCIFPRLT